MKKTDFKPFKVGTVFNEITKIGSINTDYRLIEISYPSRLKAMALDPSKIASNNNLVYTPGEVIFKVGIYKNIKIKKIGGSELKLILNVGCKRKSLVRHALLIMAKAISIKEGLYVEVDNGNEIRHAGLGSSSGLIASVACAINELYGCPIDADDLLAYLAQNHGEEIDGDEENLTPVQCIGGSAAAGLYSGGLLFLAGESKVIFSTEVNSSYKAIIGIPKNYHEMDAAYLLEKEIEFFPQFIATGERYSGEIAYRLIHKVFPTLSEYNLSEIGSLIFDYRFRMGSIRNCSYSYPKMVDIAEKIETLYLNKFAEVLGLSSVGPAFFAISTNPDICQKIFEKENLRTRVCEIVNERYKIVNIL